MYNKATAESHRDPDKYFDYTDPEGHVYKVRPNVVTYDDVYRWVPILKGHSKIVTAIFKFLMMDKVNLVHGRLSRTPGIAFSDALIEDELQIKTIVDNEEILDRFKDTAFVTVSNHPYGSVDGVELLHIVGRHRPDFKVMVNFFLDNLTAMRPNFIAVDPSASEDPQKRAISIEGIREAIRRVREGHPVGFFPAGAVSKIQRNLRIRDRAWQPTIIRLISKLGVPVVPIYFHGHNSAWFNILGLISWQIRTLRLPAEVFEKRGKTIHISIGEPIMPATLKGCGSEEELCELLRKATYSLADKYGDKK